MNQYTIPCGMPLVKYLRSNTYKPLPAAKSDAAAINAGNPTRITLKQNALRQQNGQRLNPGSFAVSSTSAANAAARAVADGDDAVPNLANEPIGCAAANAVRGWLAVDDDDEMRKKYL